jgi:hypothetical protein
VRVTVADLVAMRDGSHVRIHVPPLTLAALVLASSVFTTWLAWQPVEHIVAYYVSDDAFYYFQTARTITDGGGVSVDGEVWANGFHPLWLLILLPIYALPIGDQTAVHLALTISGAVVALSAIPLYAVARRLGISQLVSIAVAALYLMHPVVLYMSVNGLETGVNLAIFVVLLYAFVRCWQEPQPRNEIFVSAVAGVLVLSRTDYGITAAIILFALVLRARAEAGSLARLAIPAIAITAPWFVWNIAVFGSPLQGSAGAIPYVEHQFFPHPDASAAELIRYALGQIRADTEVLSYVYFTRTLDSGWFAAGAIALLVVASMAVAYAYARCRVPLMLLAIPAAGLIAQFLVHAGIRWYMREWYLVATFPVLALLLGMVVDSLVGSRARLLAPALVGVVLIATAVKAEHTYTHAWYGLQPDMLEASRWIDAETPPDARVGAFNSGIVGYFSHRTTVNLDGVMNPDAFDAIKRRRVAAYVDEREIDYIADFPFYPFWFYRPFLGGELRATEVARFDAELTFQGPFVVYELERH